MMRGTFARWGRAMAAETLVAGRNRPSIALTVAATQRFGYTPSKVDPDQPIWSGAAAG